MSCQEYVCCNSLFSLFAVPVEIVNTTTPVHQNFTKNQPVTLYVEFRGRQAHNLTITWFFGDIALSSTDGYP